MHSCQWTSWSHPRRRYRNCGPLLAFRWSTTGERPLGSGRVSRAPGRVLVDAAPTHLSRPSSPREHAHDQSRIRCRKPPTRTPSPSAAAAYTAALETIAAAEPDVAAAIAGELASQRRQLKLIASENYASPAVLLAMGNWLSDKYAEGTVGQRFYAGCEMVDRVESIAAGHATALFGADHAYVQPHSGIDANLVAFWAILARRVEEPALAAAGVRTRQRPGPGGLGAAARRPALAADAGHGARRRRPPDPRVPAQHLGQALRAVELRDRPGDRATRLRRDRRPGARVPPGGAGRRVLGLPADPELRDPARDRRRGRRHPHGGHGALRRPGRGRRADRRPEPGPARRRGHVHHPQVAARPARRVRALHRRVRPVRRQGLPDGPRRPAAARDGGQGDRVRRGPPALVRRLRVRDRRQRPGAGRGADRGAGSGW